MAVFDKGYAFNPRSDPIVRVQARRLRAQLARYYQEEGQDDEIAIELPKGNYAVVFVSAKPPVPEPLPNLAPAAENTVLVMPFSDHSPEGDQQIFVKVCVRRSSAL